MLKKALMILFACASTAQAEFATEQADENGVINPQDFSWRAYLEEMDRFPERLGIICYNAYILNKTPDHASAFVFFNECAKRGNAPSMINLAQFHADGKGTVTDAGAATYWLRRAAESGYAAGEYEYGLALMRGDGTSANLALGEFWLRRAVAHGDKDAKTALLAAGKSVQY